MQYKHNIQKLDTNTDGQTDGLCPVGILPRVAKKLQHFATITNGQTDKFCPVCILPRVVKNLQHCVTIIDGYTDRLCPVGILPIVTKQLQPLPQSSTSLPTKSATDGAHSNEGDCQIVQSVGTIIDGITEERDKSNAPVL